MDKKENQEKKVLLDSPGLRALQVRLGQGENLGLTACKDLQVLLVPVVKKVK